MHRTFPEGSSRHPRQAFTLVEMLVAITIIAILGVLAVTMVNVSFEGDRIRGSARQIQSYLQGARDRAIHAGQVRGVRFLLEENGVANSAGNPKTVTSMIFIGAPGVVRGTLRIVDRPPQGTPAAAYRTGYRVELVFDPATGLPLDGGKTWTELYNTRLLVRGSRIRLINGSNDYFASIHNSSFPPPGQSALPGNSPIGGNQLVLDRLHPDLKAGTQNPVARRQDLIYEIELAPAVMANQDPMLLSQGVVLDLDNSRLPGDWHNPARTVYSDRMDILFSPRGSVVGAAASVGLLHFLVTDVGDVELAGNAGVGAGIGDPNKEREELLVSLFTRTGHIVSTPLDPTDLVENANPSNQTPDGIPDNPFRLAELGEMAK
ncbi:MAG: prepilin-type N-terminal cleavage/methylation domain-containing protein [Planctomycetes bacterium]|nr:prepilin-type N-terminal cleavage/methylation domain-containing protein [Planctomycetota bacterium]